MSSYKVPSALIKCVIPALTSIGIIYCVFLITLHSRSDFLVNTSSRFAVYKLHNNSVHKPQEVDDENISMDDMMKYFYETNSSSCKQAVDFGFALSESWISGMAPDGFKAVCMDPGVRPTYNNCLVYSFGIRDEWSFDEDMQKFGCQVFAFDPSMKANDHQRSERIWFYKLGLSGENVDIGPSSPWKMRTLPSIYEMLNERHGSDKVIDYLKVDIEFSEWETLPQIYETGMLSKVKQIAIDVHLRKMSSLATFRKHYKTIRSLEKDHGFYRFSSRPSVWGREYIEAWGRLGNYAFEMAWYNSRYLNDTFLNDPFTYW